MKHLIAPALIALAAPAHAAKGPFVSLANTDFIVLIGFLVFVGVLLYFKVPGMLMGMLDKRAEGIQSDLDEARALRDEAQAVLASFERKQAEVAEQSEAIVKAAREEAEAAAAQAKIDLEASIARRLAAAEDQIASAEAAAVKEVRERAIAVAIGAAGDVIAKGMTAQAGNDLIDEAIGKVEEKLH